jgi:hypothetical protein
MTPEELAEQEAIEQHEAESKARYSEYAELKLAGLSDYSFDTQLIGEDHCKIHLYQRTADSGFPVCTKFADFNSTQFSTHYAGYRAQLEVAKLVCLVAKNPEEYTSLQLRNTAMRVLGHMNSTFCSSSWEGSAAITEALQAKRNTDYGSFFTYAVRPSGYPASASCTAPPATQS